MPEQVTIRVCVACAAPGHVFLRELELPAGANVGDAIAAAAVREAWPDLAISPGRVGIFARKTGFDAPLAEGDRVEIYRPLKIDPKEARRKRAIKPD